MIVAAAAHRGGKPNQKAPSGGNEWPTVPAHIAALRDVAPGGRPLGRASSRCLSAVAASTHYVTCPASFRARQQISDPCIPA